MAEAVRYGPDACFYVQVRIFTHTENAQGERHRAKRTGMLSPAIVARLL